MFTPICATKTKTFSIKKIEAQAKKKKKKKKKKKNAFLLKIDAPKKFLNQTVSVSIASYLTHTYLLNLIVTHTAVFVCYENLSQNVPCMLHQLAYLLFSPSNSR